MNVNCNISGLEQELSDLLKLFLPSGGDLSLLVTATKTDRQLQVETFVDGKSYRSTLTVKPSESITEERRLLKRGVKVAVYDALSSFLNIELPWGSLTGIRPTKIAYDMLNEGTKPHILREVLIKDFRISPEKADLTVKVIKNQTCIIRNDHLVDFYINIPVCPTRCAYCSFISSDLEEIKDLIPKYVDSLLKEIRAAKALVNERAYVVRTIYMGGGTPSILRPSQLDAVLSELTYPVNEITVECGRPDTVTEEKLNVLKKHGVTRISINPQTFCEATLKRIGRHHSVKDVIASYKLALQLGFDVNMDIIAGLPGESVGIFKRSVDTVLEFFPENITLHTLAIKNGSSLKSGSNGHTQSSDPSKNITDAMKMLNYGHKRLMEKGYKPYYVYRQKNQLGGLENVGYFRDGKICLFNVDSMEETCSVVACGANAVSKRVFNIEGRIERMANVKFVNEYIERIDEMIERKRKLFS